MPAASAASRRQHKTDQLKARIRHLKGASGWRMLVWPSYLLLLLMPSSLFWPLATPVVLGVFLPYVTPGIFLPDLAVALLLASLIASGRWPIKGPLEIIIPLIGLGLLAIMTAPWALSAPLALYTAVRWLLAACATMCFANTLAGRRQIVLVFLAGLCLQTMIGLGQVVAKGPLGLPGEMAFANSNELAWTFRAFGFTFHPNVLGGYLVVGLLLSIPLLSRKLVLAGWCLLWLGLLATFSRSAWLAAAATVPLALLWHLKWKPEMRRTLLAAILGVLIVFGLAGFIWQEQMAVRLQPLLAQAQEALGGLLAAEAVPPAPVSNVAELDLNDAMSSSNYAISERFVQFEIAFMAIKQSFAHGVGAGGFALFMRQLDLIVAPNIVHNVPLMLAAEVGVVGAGLWLALCLIMAWWLVKFWRAGAGWLIVALCGFLALATIALFDFYPWGLNTGRLLTALVLGFIARSLPAPTGSVNRVIQPRSSGEHQAESGP